MLKRLVLLTCLASGAWAFLAWPRINEVQTGRTPEYPDLRDRAYATTESRVFDAVKKVIGQLPRWTLVGGGSGPGGHSIHAIKATPLGLKHDVTIRIGREGGQTRVSVRSKSRTGPVDFGQNARNIRELLAALDREVS